MRRADHRVPLPRHAFGKAHEIDNEMAKHLLTAEFVAGESLGSQLLPQRLFIRRLLLT
jgi:hypothetical protein